ncbi:hypothetical protein K4B79_11330 [Streptomyces lincolnensis]|uniref:hypothetical protein n=1 Tax=Streptomyces lincolnensis TaxID=1915 RepID=UPI001E48404B|nr:hypothetical protein [Streptomyces lincolnensis]MCD7438812.1 hypothetical protein [Streptomyces lincolnensis]
MPDMSASASLAITQFATLAKEVDEDKVTPGVLGFIVFAAMAVAVWALMKSMSRHMNRVDFKEPPEPKAASGSTTETAPESATESTPADTPAEPGAKRG